MRKPHLHITRKRILTLLAVCMVAPMAYALWPRSSLWRYTSPPMTIGGKSVRLSVLVPRGLIPHPQPPKSPTEKYATPIYTNPDPHERMTWLPSGVRRWLGLYPEPNCSLMVEYANRGGKKGGLVLLGGESEVGADGITTSSNILGLHAAYLDGDWEVSYSRGDRSAFDATYREVCKSLKILPGDAK